MKSKRSHRIIKSLDTIREKNPFLILRLEVSMQNQIGGIEL